MTTMLSRPGTATPTRRASRFTWLSALIVVLAVALGFGAGFLTSQQTQDDPTGLAPDATVSLIEDNMAAFNAGDAQALAATTTPDVTYTMIDPSGVLGELNGPENVLGRLGQTHGLRATSEYMQQGHLVTVSYREAATEGITIYEITAGKISHAWIIMS